MKEAAGPDEQGCHGKRRSPGHSQGHSQKEKRCNDHVFRHRESMSGCSRAGTEDHGGYKGGGQQPEGASPQPDRPESHRHHHEKVIVSREGVKESRPGGRFCGLRMVLKGVGRCGKNGQCEEWKGEQALHEVYSKPFPCCFTRAKTAPLKIPSPHSMAIHCQSRGDVAGSFTWKGRCFTTAQYAQAPCFLLPSNTTFRPGRVLKAARFGPPLIR